MIKYRYIVEPHFIETPHGTWLRDGYHVRDSVEDKILSTHKSDWPAISEAVKLEKSTRI